MNDGQRVILGIDPGTMILGYGVILADRRKVHYVDMGVVDLRKEKDHFAKLNTIFTEVSGIISRYNPDDVAVEAPFRTGRGLEGAGGPDSVADSGHGA